MKIGIVCYPSVGGSGVIATELGHELAKRGHEIHFITYEMPFRLNLTDKNIHFHEVEIHQYELFKYPDYALTLAVKMASVAERYDLDLIHVHYAIPHATSAFLARQILKSMRPAIITTLHGTDISLVGRDPAYYKVVKMSIEQSDGITAVSHSLHHDICRYFKICKGIEVIHNFFTPKPQYIGKKVYRNHFVSGDEKLLIHASNYRGVKRSEDALAIFEKVREQIPAKLIFLGSGSGLEKLHHLVHEKGLQEQVFFEGKSRDVDAYVSSADLFLLPSSTESFGLAALEAMAYGVPVVGTDVGGLPEVVENGKTGYLSAVGDVNEMAENAVKLLSQTDLYQRFSQAAQERAATHFSTEKIVPQYEEYYVSILRRTMPI